MHRASRPGNLAGDFSDINVGFIQHSLSSFAGGFSLSEVSSSPCIQSALHGGFPARQLQRIFGRLFPRYCSVLGYHQRIFERFRAQEREAPSRPPNPKQVYSYSLPFYRLSDGLSDDICKPAPLSASFRLPLTVAPPGHAMSRGQEEHWRKMPAWTRRVLATPSLGFFGVFANRREQKSPAEISKAKLYGF